jgi:phage repressor protein C with HTH and peptisase S24 domain
MATELQGESGDSEFAERMEALIKRVGSVGELERKSGVARRMIDKYRTGRVEPGRDRLVALARGASVSLLWLATGEGDVEPSPVLPFSSQNEESNDYVIIPRYDVQAAAGHGNAIVSEPVPEYVYFHKDWLKNTLGVSASHLALLVAAGDSMAETIRDGDLMIIDTSNPRFRGDGVYVFSLDDCVMVKRLALRLAGGLWISSDNKKYPEVLEIPAAEVDRRVRVVGKVVWIGGKL